MKKTECIWRTSFVPSVMGDVEQETGFDDFDRVYLEHRDNIEEGVHCLATFVREHMQVDNRSEFVLTHGCQGRSIGGGRIIGYDFIDVFRGFLALIFASSTVEFARRQAHGGVEGRVVFTVRIFKGQYEDFHLQVRQQTETEELENTQSLDFLPDRYPLDKEIGNLLRSRFGLQLEPICRETDAPAA